MSHNELILRESTTIFHCMMILIHLFIFTCIKIAFKKIKSEREPNATMRAQFHDDYFTKIEESKKNFNEGYECPKIISKEELSSKNENDENLYEVLQAESAVRNAVGADIHEMMTPNFYNNESDIYDEATPMSNYSGFGALST